MDYEFLDDDFVVGKIGEDDGKSLLDDNQNEKKSANDKRYACDQCDTSFARSHSLRLHKKSIHQDIRPHVCARCDKRFCTMHGLNQHLRTHTGRGRTLVISAVCHLVNELVWKIIKNSSIKKFVCLLVKYVAAAQLLHKISENMLSYIQVKFVVNLCYFF